MKHEDSFPYILLDWICLISIFFKFWRVIYFFESFRLTHHVEFLQRNDKNAKIQERDLTHHILLLSASRFSHNPHRIPTHPQMDTPLEKVTHLENYFIFI